MKKKVIISIFIIFFLTLLFSCFVYFKKDKVIITLNGDKSINLEINDDYKELGAVGKICSFNKCFDVTDDIYVDNEIDNDILGIQKVTYTINYKNKKYIEERIVNVVDIISPEINLLGKKTVQICPKKDYIEEGYSAFDNYDGDISNKVIVNEKDNSIIYEVTDSSNNKTSVSRDIIKSDIIKPVIKLNGSGTVSLKLNEKYVEQGVTVSDNCDSISVNDVEITSNVDTSKVGNYNVMYSVKDKSGNVATVNRTVKVKKDIVFETDSKKEYIQNLESYIKEKNYNISLGYVNLNTGYTYTYNKNTIYYGASLVKTVGALYIYEKTNFTEATRKKVENAISVSNNQAHNDIVNLIGIENLRKYGRSLGASNFLTRSNKDYFGNTTVSDQIAIWKYLYKFINSDSKGSELKKYFINDYCNYLLFDGIPTTMHKYGYYGAYYHDVGIVYSDNPYIIVVLTKHGNGNYKSIVKDLSKKIYELNLIDE